MTPFHYVKKNGAWFRCLFQLLNTYWEPTTCQVWYYMSEHKAIISLHFMSLLYGKTTMLEFWKSIALEDQTRLVRKWTEWGSSDLARGSSFIQFGVYQVSLFYTWAQKSSRVQKLILWVRRSGIISIEKLWGLQKGKWNAFRFQGYLLLHLHGG